MLADMLGVIRAMAPFLLLLGGLWLFFLWAAYANGWKELVARFASHHPPFPDARNLGTVSMVLVSASRNASTNYPFGMRISVDVGGIVVRPRGLVRPFHPPVAIPWDAVADARKVPRHSYVEHASLGAVGFLFELRDDLPEICFYGRRSEDVFDYWSERFARSRERV